MAATSCAESLKSADLVLILAVQRHPSTYCQNSAS
jgi:hypothetical protein